MMISPPPLAPRILIVDRQPALATSLRLSLENRNYAVRLTQTATDALRFAGDARPLLVVVDTELPGKVSAVRLAEHLQANLGIPVVFLAPSIDDALEQASSAVGALACLLKSADVEALADAIVERAAARLDASARPLADAQWQARRRRDFAVACFAAMIGETPEAVRSLISKYVRDHNLRLDAVIEELERLIELDHALQHQYRQRRWELMSGTLRDLCRHTAARSSSGQATVLLAPRPPTGPLAHP
jgi:CheY-like chemotaxis protein